MGACRGNKTTIVAAMALLTCIGLLSEDSLAAENPRISDGSRVTLFYQITVLGEGGFEIEDATQFVQGQHQLLPALEQVVTGMKTGEETKVDLSAEDGFGPYDAKKRKAIAR